MLAHGDITAAEYDRAVARAARPPSRDALQPSPAPELLRLGRAAAGAHVRRTGASRPAGSTCGRRSSRASSTPRAPRSRRRLPHADRPGGGARRDRPSTGAVRAMSTTCPAGGSSSSTSRRRAAGRPAAPSSRSCSRPRSTRASRSTPRFSGPPATRSPTRAARRTACPGPSTTTPTSPPATMNLLDATAHSVNTIFAQLVDQGRRPRTSSPPRTGWASRTPLAAGLLDHARHAGRSTRSR